LLESGLRLRIPERPSRRTPAGLNSPSLNDVFLSERVVAQYPILLIPLEDVFKERLTAASTARRASPTPEVSRGWPRTRAPQVKLAFDQIDLREELGSTGFVSFSRGIADTATRCAGK
jgi:hypothetical protein